MKVLKVIAVSTLIKGSIFLLLLTPPGAPVRAMLAEHAGLFASTPAPLTPKADDPEQRHHDEYAQKLEQVTGDIRRLQKEYAKADKELTLANRELDRARALQTDNFEAIVSTVVAAEQRREDIKAELERLRANKLELFRIVDASLELDAGYDPVARHVELEAYRKAVQQRAELEKQTSRRERELQRETELLRQHVQHLQQNASEESNPLLDTAREVIVAQQQEIEILQESLADRQARQLARVSTIRSQPTQANQKAEWLQGQQRPTAELQVHQRVIHEPAPAYERSAGRPQPNPQPNNFDRDMRPMATPKQYRPVSIGGHARSNSPFGMRLACQQPVRQIEIQQIDNLAGLRVRGLRGVEPENVFLHKSRIVVQFREAMSSFDIDSEERVVVTRMQ